MLWRDRDSTPPESLISSFVLFQWCTGSIPLIAKRCTVGISINYFQKRPVVGVDGVVVVSGQVSRFSRPFDGSETDADVGSDA